MPRKQVKWHVCPFFDSQTCCVMIPARDAHVLVVTSLEDQQAPLPASPLHHLTAGSRPTRGRCPLLPEVSQPKPAAPSYSWERQTGPWSPSRERLLAAQFELLIQPWIRQWGWDCHHKMLHFASLAYGPKFTKCRGKSSAFHDIWIRLPTFNI